MASAYGNYTPGNSRFQIVGADGILFYIDIPSGGTTSTMYKGDGTSLGSFTVGKSRDGNTPANDTTGWHHFVITGNSTDGVKLTIYNYDGTTEALEETQLSESFSSLKWLSFRMNIRAYTSTAALDNVILQTPKPEGTPDAPEFSSEGTGKTPIVVTLTTATEDASIYYWIGAGNEEDKVLYTEPFTMNQNGTDSDCSDNVYAYAIKDELKSETVSQFFYSNMQAIPLAEPSEVSRRGFSRIYVNASQANTLGKPTPTIEYQGGSMDESSTAEEGATAVVSVEGLDTVGTAEAWATHELYGDSSHTSYSAITIPSTYSKTFEIDYLQYYADNNGGSLSYGAAIETQYNETTWYPITVGGTAIDQPIYSDAKDTRYTWSADTGFGRNTNLGCTLCVADVKAGDLIVFNASSISAATNAASVSTYSQSREFAFTITADDGYAIFAVGKGDSIYFVRIYRPCIATVDGTGYSTIAAAKEAADASGSDIILNTDAIQHGTQALEGTATIKTEGGISIPPTAGASAAFTIGEGIDLTVGTSGTSAFAVGEGSSSTGTLVVEGSVTSGELQIAHGATSTGTVTIKGSYTEKSGNTLVGHAKNSVGTLNIDGGAFTNSAGSVQMGRNPSATGTINITNGGELYGASTLILGNTANAGDSTVTINNGTLTLPKNNLIIGNGENTKGTVNLVDGTATVSALVMGNGKNSTGILNISGGTIDATSYGETIGAGEGSTSEINISGGNAILVGKDRGMTLASGASSSVKITVSDSGTATFGASNSKWNDSYQAMVTFANGEDATADLEFAGGTTILSYTRKTTETGTATLTFNGGTVKPSLATETWINAATGFSCVIDEGGMVIDTDGNDVTITADVTSTLSAPTLLKKGTGKLTFTGAVPSGLVVTVEGNGSVVLPSSAENPTVGTYTQLESGTTYTYSMIKACKIGDTYYPTLALAYAAAQEVAEADRTFSTVGIYQTGDTLSEDITINEGEIFWFKNDSGQEFAGTITLNGGTLTLDPNLAGSFTGSLVSNADKTSFINCGKATYGGLPVLTGEGTVKVGLYEDKGLRFGDGAMTGFAGKVVFMPTKALTSAMGLMHAGAVNGDVAVEIVPTWEDITEPTHAVDFENNGTMTMKSLTISDPTVKVVVKYDNKEIRFAGTDENYLNGTFKTGGMTIRQTGEGIMHIGTGFAIEGSGTTTLIPEKGSFVVDDGADLSGVYVTLGHNSYSAVVVSNSFTCAGLTDTKSVAPDGYTKTLVYDTEDTSKLIGITIARDTSNDVAQIDDVTYPTLAEAVEAAQSGDTVTLIADVTLTDKLVVSNKTVTITADSAKTITGQLRVVDGSSCTIGENITITSDKHPTVFVLGDPAVKTAGTAKSTLVVNGKVLNTNTGFDQTFAIAGNGLDTQGVDITINGTVRNDNGIAIYQAFPGSLVINGTVAGASAVSIKDGTLTVNDGAEITATLADGLAYVGNNNGESPTGDAIIAPYYPLSKGYGTPVVSIVGGTITVTDTTNCTGIEAYDFDGTTAPQDAATNVNVSGGLFNTPVAEVYCASGYIPCEVTGGYSVKVQNTGIDPTDPTSTQEVTVDTELTAEEQEAAAIAAATVTVPTAAAEAGVDAETYKGYFTYSATATETAGTYSVAITGFADEVTETADGNALSALETAAAGAALGSIEVKPGLYYGTAAGDDVTTLKASAGELNTTGSLDLSDVTKPSTGEAFFIKIKVGATAFTAEE